MTATLLSGWGRFPVAPCRLERPRTADVVSTLLTETSSAVARGSGRSYGDSSLNPALTIESLGLDRMLAFDPETGVLTCESGVILADIIRAMLPRGWFPSVTPGTRLVTIGGMIAADVHGKNHHGAGSFCDHLDWVDLQIAPGEVLRCSRTENAELFAATCGGLGLTGVVLRAAFRLLRVETSMIRQKTLHAANLDEAITQLEALSGWTYSVAWIDCLAEGAALGRSLVFLGEHALKSELAPEQASDPLAWPARRTKTVPIDFPDFALSRLSVRVFNAIYYGAHPPGETLVGGDKYFYPLDALQQWNRIYGRRGFAQYQCVLPLEESALGMRRLLTTIAREGDASFLAVLKLMGDQSFGLMSFPRPGLTLALDFPVTPASIALMDRLDAITAEHSGRIYLAKDARTSVGMTARGYPGLEAFREVRLRYGLSDRFRSMQSNRLEL